MNSTPFKAFAIGTALGLVLAVAPSCGSASGSCGPDNCASGCCANGQCLSGTSLNECGKGGGQCLACATGQSCSAGSCGSTQFTGGGQGGGTGAGGGGGTETCGPSNCQTGCCFRNSCFTGRSVGACGSAGSACLVCPDNNVCTTGVCEARPDGGTVVNDAGVIVTTDAGTNDSGVVVVADAGVTDSGVVVVVDAGTTDSGVVVVVDSGVVDSGMPGPIDAGSFTGDGGSCHPNVVISQVYNNNDKTGSTYNSQYVEIHNRSSLAIDLTGWALQVATATSTNWSVVALTGVLPANGWVLVQGTVGSSHGANLPMPYIVGGGSLDLALTHGMKIALTNSTSGLSGHCPKTAASVVDFMSYGSQADCWEGDPTNDGPAFIFSTVTDAYVRASGACQDTNATSTDFTEAAASPHTASSAGNTCGCQQ